jgi:UDP-N-acetylmuramoyl-L-alanine---L-glutamate ligase
MKLEKLKNKNILILGFGSEGQDTFKFLRKLYPLKIIGIADKEKELKFKFKNLKKVKWHLGKDYLKSLKNYDLIIKSPGIPFKILSDSALKKITTQTEIFFENCPGKIIGITGTKGKSTTTSIIYEILKNQLKIQPLELDGQRFNKIDLIGNIGKPALCFLLKAKKNNIFVYELSSHQLYRLKKSPQIAVFLNLYPEHLDYYKNFQEYANAKANIALFQKKEDYLVYNAGDKIVKKTALKSLSKKIPIKGEYYDLDRAAARAVGKIFKISPQVIEKSIKKFKGLPHRLELVGTFRGVTFYNDALATIPEATIFAINTLGDKVETIILGGFDRNINFKKLADRVLESKIKTIILFPPTGKKIWNNIVRQNNLKTKNKKLNHYFIDKKGICPAEYIKEAVKLAYQNTKKGKICLLSNACPSFGIFKNYKEKGDLFKKYVKKSSIVCLK